MTAISYCSAAVGSAVLAGYAVPLRWPVDALSDVTVIAPVTAAGTSLTAAALWCVASRVGHPRRRRAGQALGLLVAALGAAVLFEYISRHSLGIDLLLFGGTARAWLPAGVPGRPAPHAALLFLVIGLALVFLDAEFGPGVRPARVLSPAAALIAAVALLGCICKVEYLRASAHVSGMSLTCASTLTALAVGIVLCRPEQPPMTILTGGGVGGAVVRRLTLTCAGVIAVIGVVLAAAGRSGGLLPGLGVTLATTILIATLYAVLAHTRSALDRAERDQLALIAALSTERDFSQTVVRSLRDGVIVFDRDGMVLQASPRWFEITGYSSDEIIGRSAPFPWWPADDEARRLADWTAVLTSQEAVEGQTDIERPDGAPVNVSATFVPVRQATGAVRMFVATYRDLTQHNKVEAEGRRAAEQLDHFFDRSSDLMCIAGVDGYFKRVNRAWASVLGYPAEELLATPYIEFVHPDDVARTNDELAGHASSRVATIGFENRYRCRDGSYRWLNWNATVIPDERLVYAVARDTTALREADEIQAWLAAIVDSTEDAVIGKTLDGTIVSWNGSAERIYGYSAAEAIGQSIGLIFLPERSDEVDELLAGIARGEAVRLDDTVRQCKDGTAIHVALSIAPIRDAGGAIIGAASVARDVSARVIAEERFRQVLLAAPDAMVIVDADGKIVVVNEQTERLFEYHAAELIDQPVEMLVPERLRDQHIGYRRHYLGKPTVHGMGIGLALSGRRRDGSEFPIEVSLAPLAVDTGTLVSAAIRDVTDRRHAEEELARARDDALAATKAKSLFVAMVSHEIRTPMNGVIGLTRLLLETSLEPVQRRYTEAIRTSGSALLTIINDILDFSKIESGKIELLEADFDLRRLLEEVIAVAAELGRDKDVEIVGYYPPTLPTIVRGDGGRLRQCLLNLVGNAVKFTEHGEVLVTAGLTTSPGQTSRQMTFAVADTGIGVAADQLQRLFEPFTQLDDAANRRLGGTGLGLTICHELVKLMRGRIEATSEPGQGSRFAFTIPLAESADPSADAAPATRALSGRRLLIVDDNQSNLRLVDDHTRAWGMEPTTARDGDRALTHLRDAATTSRPYEVAILDQHMPECNGLEVADAIAADPAIPDLSVILLTSDSYLQGRPPVRADTTAMLPKPVGPSQLYNALIRLLTKDADPPGPASPDSAADQAGPIEHGRILVAEDNDINQMVALGTLTSMGYQADVARNGLEAIDLATTTHYDAVLMDCQMPTMDGYEATAELRRREGTTRHTPVIAMTAGARAEDRERCLAAGMDGFVPKPIDPEQLTAALQRWAAETPPAPADPRHEQPPDLPPPHDAIDRRLALLRNGQPATAGDLGARVIDAFRSAVPEHLMNIAEAIAAQRTDLVQRHAHDLISVAASLGAETMIQLSEQLRTAGESGDLIAATALVDDIRAEYENVGHALGRTH